MSQHQIPYYAAPIRICEAALKDAKPPLPEHALPATLPPFAQVLLSPLGRLDVYAVERLFFIAAFLAVAAAIVTIRRLVMIPIEMVIIMTIGSMYLSSQSLGAVAPFVYYGIALAAAGYVKSNKLLFALGLCLTCLQPATGLAIAATVFIRDQKYRIPVLASLVVLLGVSVSTGLELFKVYFPMLSIHARAEEYQIFQISLTYLAHAAGVAEQAASTIGTLGYAVWIACAVFVAFRFPLSDPRIVAVAAALSVLPGSFNHYLYCANAVLFISLMMRRSETILPFAAAALLTAYWQPIEAVKYNVYLYVTVFAVAAIAATLFSGKRRIATVILAILLPLAFCKFCISVTAHEQFVPLSAQMRVFASEEWYDFLVGQPAANLSLWLQKVPYFLAEIFVLIMAFREARRYRVLASDASEQREPAQV